MTDTTSPAAALSLADRIQGRRRRVNIGGDADVETAPLFASDDLGRRIDAEAVGRSLPDWYAAHRGSIEDVLHRHGALLLRGFAVTDARDFAAVMEVVGRPLDYTYRSTPRTALESGIYTSTEYPAAEFIPLHNENSYAAAYPDRIVFFCETAPTDRGATPIADGQAVYRDIAPDVRARFEAHGVLYVRNFGALDLDWRTAFQTDDRTIVDQFCDAVGIDAEWRDDGTLVTRQVCPAVRVHPVTGAPVWFNQAHLFHVSALPPLVAEELLGDLGEARLPRNAYYGDGSTIDDDALREIREAYARHTRSFAWHRGDVLVLDNLRCAHGREPFSGPRRILVGMTNDGQDSGR